MCAREKGKTEVGMEDEEEEKEEKVEEEEEDEENRRRRNRRRVSHPHNMRETPAWIRQVR